MSGRLQQRPARPSERCTCGRPAVLVFLGAACGDTGYCGIPDGGLTGICPFCGQHRDSHPGGSGRCPQYRLNPEATGCGDAS